MGRTIARRPGAHRAAAVLRHGEHGMHRVPGVPEHARQLPADIRTLTVDPGLLRAMSKDIQGEFFCLNPSVAVHQGQLLASVRVQFRSVPHSRGVIGRIDDDWQLKDARWMRDYDGRPKNPNGRCLGFEDCRLFSWNGRLAACATVCDRVPNDPYQKLAVLEISDAGDVMHVHVQPSRRQEKNWMPLVQDDKLKFVYSFDPYVIVEYDATHHRVHPSATDLPMPASTIRGGSQLVPYGDGYLAVVHTVHAPQVPRAKNVYMHQLALFDRDARPVRRSEPFYFEHHGLEFCAGLALWRDTVVLSYGVSDRYPKLALVNKAVVERMVGPNS